MNVRRKVFNPEVETPIKLKPYKYDFSKECKEELAHFAMLHKFDERKQFKEAWTKWVECHQSLINNEKQLMANYDGDVVEKMFVSVRYYFRKKRDKSTIEQKPRKKYESLDRMFLATMDKHLYALIQNNINQKTNISDTAPSDAYELFCEQYLHEIEKMDCSDIKIKKTFKNRYHMMKKTLTGK